MMYSVQVVLSNEVVAVKSNLYSIGRKANNISPVSKINMVFGRSLNILCTNEAVNFGAYAENSDFIRKGEKHVLVPGVAPDGDLEFFDGL